MKILIGTVVAVLLSVPVAAMANSPSDCEAYAKRAGRQTLLMSRELYATPILLGCTLYVVLLYLLPEYRMISAVGCTFFIFSIRAAAIHWTLSVPDWLTMKVKS